MGGSRRAVLVAVAAVCLVATACSGGGGVKGDPLAEAGVKGEYSVSIPGSGGFKLGGTLSVPPNLTGTAPGVLIVPTLGSVDRNGIQNETMPDPIYQELANELTADGLVTLRYDRRGIGASKITGQKISYNDLLADAQDALKFLAARKEVGSSALAVIGHDVTGAMALDVAAGSARVKSVLLLSSPGRPIVDVLAAGYASTAGQSYADQFRTIAAGLVANGTMPGPAAIPAQLQNVLQPGQQQILQGLFAVDPAVEAAKVHVPVLVVVSSKSNTITRADADRLAAAIGPDASILETDSGPTLREVVPDRPPVAFDPNNENTHVGGARIVDPEPRDQASMDKVTSWIATQVGAAHA